LSENTKHVLLIVHDAKPNQYTILEHNLEPEKASELVEEWKAHLKEGCTFITLDHNRQHKTPDAQDCRACRDQVRQSSGLQPPPKFKRRDA